MSAIAGIFAWVQPSGQITWNWYASGEVANLISSGLNFYDADGGGEFGWIPNSPVNVLEGAYSINGVSADYAYFNASYEMTHSMPFTKPGELSLPSYTGTQVTFSFSAPGAATSVRTATGVGVIGDPSEALNTDLSVFVDAYRAVYYPLAGLWGDAVGHYYDLRTSSTGDSNGQ
ncbi:hypothetical protein ACJJIW_16060 [Microbulbifer sp. JMSA004]|uniref:hypothetical protein n=1 Tax=Microbulbifer sp. JMSA004 TaxID=3243370 RepID=UPI00403A7ADB